MRIGEAKQRDVGKKRARVGPEAMDFLKAEPGDIVEIMGSRTTCAIIWPVDEDEKFEGRASFKQEKQEKEIVIEEIDNKKKKKKP